MRKALSAFAVLGLIVTGFDAAAAQAISPAAGAAVSGVFTVGGESAMMTDVSAHKAEPSDGQPVTALVFTVTAQNGDAEAGNDAWNGVFGDAIIVNVQSDGEIIGVDMRHHGLDRTHGHFQVGGQISMKEYRSTDGQISGVVTSDGPFDTYAGQINVRLAFHVKAP